jgi:putative hydrolase of the HAD superfamily
VAVTHNGRVIVFDLDDTLYPEQDYVRSGLRAAGDFARVHFAIDGIAAIAISLFESGRRADLFQAALEILGYERPEEEWIRALVSAYRNHLPSIRMFGDVATVLPELGQQGRLALLTDGYLPPQRLKVKALGVDALCDPVIYTEEMGRHCWKPAPDAFISLEQLCRARPEECIYIGDNPAKDFVAPRLRGWQSVRVRRSGTEHAHVKASREQEANFEVTDFWQLRRLLA